MKLAHLDLKNVRGLADKAFGLGKEVFGTAVGNTNLSKEGEAQQARGTESLKALRAQGEAQSHAAKAEALETKQKAARQAKQAT